VLFNKKSAKQFLVLSLFAHLVMLYIAMPEVGIKKYEASKPSILKLTIKSLQLAQDSKQIVQTEKSKNKELVKPTFLSEENNTFDRETKAAIVDKFNTAGKGVRTGDIAKQQVDASSKSKETKTKDISLADLSVSNKVGIDQIKPSPASAALGLENGHALSQGLSSNNDYMQDIPLGDFTKVNSQEFKFYGFYHRIREKLEQFWGRNIQEQAYKMFKQGRRIASDDTHITSLIITLNAVGEIENVQVKSTSGVSELDNVAIESFNQAGPFPNPPKEMLRNGKAQIEWGFVVNS
jgi:protein TonB